MSAVGALIQATLSGEPHATRAVNAFAMAAGLNLNPNFEPATPFKQAALRSVGVGIMGASSGASYTKNLIAIIAPATISALEPVFWYLVDEAMDMNDPVNFGSCELYDAPIASSVSSSTAGSDETGVIYFATSAEQGQGRDSPAEEVEQAGHDNGGEEERSGRNGEGGNGNENYSSNCNPWQGDNLTSFEGLPAGGTPPPPPPPPGSSAALWDDSMAHLTVANFLHWALVLSLALVFHLCVEFIKSTQVYRILRHLFIRVVSRLARYFGYRNPRSQRRSVQVTRREPAFVKKAGEGKRAEFVEQKNITAISVHAHVSSTFGPGLFFVVVNNVKGFSAFFCGLLYDVVTMHHMAKMMLWTLVGFVVYNYQLLEALGIVHLGPAVDSEEFLAKLETQRVFGCSASDEMTSTGSSGEIPLSSLLSIPAAQIDTQGSIPITKSEFRQGSRMRRRTMCRKTKGSKLAPAAVESTPLIEDTDSRSLASSMWAA